MKGVNNFELDQYLIADIIFPQNDNDVRDKNHGEKDDVINNLPR